MYRTKPLCILALLLNITACSTTTSTNNHEYELTRFGFFCGAGHPDVSQASNPRDRVRALHTHMEKHRHEMGVIDTLCYSHDVCYDQASTDAEINDCDKEFLKKMKRHRFPTGTDCYLVYTKIYSAIHLKTQRYKHWQKLQNRPISTTFQAILYSPFLVAPALGSVIIFGLLAFDAETNLDEINSRKC